MWSEIATAIRIGSSIIWLRAVRRRPRTAAASLSSTGAPYYGDVSAMRFLLARGASLDSLGPNLDLNGACFHGHWRLCQLLIEQGAT